MAVGEKNSSDVEYQNKARLILYGKPFPGQDVYGDRRDPDRRDVFIDQDILDRYSDLPDTAQVEWQGQTYKAELSFRYRKGGGNIPVYEFYV